MQQFLSVKNFLSAVENEIYSLLYIYLTVQRQCTFLSVTKHYCLNSAGTKLKYYLKQMVITLMCTELICTPGILSLACGKTLLGATKCHGGRS